MLTPETQTRIREQYDPNFVKNFLNYIAQASQTGQIHTQEIMPFTNSAYNVLQSTDYTIQRKAQTPGIKPLELTVITTDIHPETRFRKLGFDKQDMFLLMGYLNSKLDTSNPEAFDKQIFMSDMDRVKTIDECVNLFHKKYKERMTPSMN